MFANDPRGLRDRARRLAEAARLPDPHPRRRLRQRALRRRRAPAPAPAARGRRPRPRPAAGRCRRDPAARAGRRSLRPPLDRCVPTGVELGEGSRVVLMPDRGGVGAALAKVLAKLGVEVLEIDGEPDGEELEGLIAEWKAAGPIQGVYWLPALDDEGPLVLARSRRLARGPARAREAAGDDDAGARRRRLGGRHLPRRGDPPRRPPRLRRGRSDLGHGRRGHRVHQGARPRACRRAGQGRRLRAQPQDHRARRAARRRDAARPRRGRDRPRRRAALDRRPRRAGGGPRPGARAHQRRRRSSSPAPPAASSPRSPPTWRPRPAAPSTCSTWCPSPIQTIRTSSASPPTATGSSASSPTGSRSAASGRRRSWSSASWRGSNARGRRSDALEAIRKAGGTAHWHQADLTDPAQVAEALAPARESGRVDVLVHAAGLEVSHFLPDKPQARVRPGLRREGRRLVQPPARAPRCRGRDGPGVQLDRRAGSGTPGRPTTRPPTT